jgi:hypothetical protein
MVVLCEFIRITFSGCLAATGFSQSWKSGNVVEKFVVRESHRKAKYFLKVMEESDFDHNSH